MIQTSPRSWLATWHDKAKKRKQECENRIESINLRSGVSVVYNARNRTAAWRWVVTVVAAAALSDLSVGVPPDSLLIEDGAVDKSAKT